MPCVPRKGNPRFDHVLVGLTVSILSYVPLWLFYRHFLVDAVAQVLSVGQVSVEKFHALEEPLLVVRSLDGSQLDLAFTLQRSGLVSLVMFSVLFLFLLFPLEGPIWRKLAWLEFGMVTGLAWSLTRLCIVGLVTCCYGVGTFTLVEFFMGPFTDFFWILSLWSLGLSSLISSKRAR